MEYLFVLTILQEPLSSNSLNIQIHRINGSDSGDSSGSPTKDGAGPGTSEQSWQQVTSAVLHSV